MKECKAPGVYGIACRKGEGCLLRGQAEDEFVSASPDDPKWAAFENQNFPQLGRKYGCPPEAVQEMEQLLERHLEKKQLDES